jgi:transcription initiation factor TFIIIB Brf1 subunit/transcription initiation factor TFIIB
LLAREYQTQPAYFFAGERISISNITKWLVRCFLPATNAVKQVEAQTQSDRIEQMPSDTQRQVEALALKLNALDVYAQMREAEVTANVILSLIERMKSDAALPKHCAQSEANAYAYLGSIALTK